LWFLVVILFYQNEDLSMREIFVFIGFAAVLILGFFGVWLLNVAFPNLNLSYGVLPVMVIGVILGHFLNEYLKSTQK